MTTKKPTPPSNWKSADGNVREDLRRIRLYLEELNDWLSDNSSDPNALTAALGDLRYLKRAANDFTSFPSATPASSDVLLIESAANGFAKRKAALSAFSFPISGAAGGVLSGTYPNPGVAANTFITQATAGEINGITNKANPVPADKILLEDSAASFGKKSATVGSLGFASIYGQGSTPLWVPPAARGLTPGAIDDEFDSTTIDPAWVFSDRTTGPTTRTPTFGTLNELVDLTGATTAPRVSLHTQGRRSWMQVQLTTTGPATYWIYKPMTRVAGQVYWTRIGYPSHSLASVVSVRLQLWANAGGVPDPNNRALVYYDFGAGVYVWLIVVGGVITNTGTNINLGYGLPEYLSIQQEPAPSTFGWHGAAFTDGGQRIIPNRFVSASFTWTPAFIGFEMRQNIPHPEAFSVDFIRENAGHPLFHF